MDKRKSTKEVEQELEEQTGFKMTTEKYLELKEKYSTMSNFIPNTVNPKSGTK